jgi:hypothetical protein
LLTRTIFIIAAVLGISALALVHQGERADAAPAPGLPLTVFQQCNAAGTVRVGFVWAPADQGTQWLDLTRGDERFLPGSFVSAGPLAQGTWAFVWDGLAPNAVHIARVNAATPTGWQPGPWLPFMTSACGSFAPASAFATIHGPCDTNGQTITFGWAPAAPQGAAQYLDLSVFNNGFAPGTFVTAGPLAGDAASFTWPGLLPGTVQYWRVNTWDGASWRTSNTQRFVTGSCRQPPLPPPSPPPPARTPGCSEDWGPVGGRVVRSLSIAAGTCLNFNSEIPFPGCFYGCYDPNTREIFLPAGGPPRDDNYTLSHELCHAHQHHVILPSGFIDNWAQTPEGVAFIAAARQALADASAGLTPQVPDFAADPIEGFAHACAHWYVEPDFGRPPLSTWPALERFALQWLPR